MFQVVFVICGLVLLICIIAMAVSIKKNENAKKTQVEQYIQEATALQSPCKIQITLNTELMQVNNICFSFSLNKSKNIQVNNGEKIEFTTSFKQNILLGYIQTVRGVAKSMKVSTIDTPFTFEAVDGGLIQILSKPEMIEGPKWKSNLTYM